MARDHELRELGALTDHEGFDRAQLERRNYLHLLTAGGLPPTGEEAPDTTAHVRVRSKAA